jgi:hypothetical protein
MAQTPTIEGGFNTVSRSLEMAKCTFCEREEMTGGYLQPPMCEKHHALTVVASLLRSRGQPVTPANIRQCVELYPKAGIQPDEVDTLCEAMPEILQPNHVSL